MVEKGTGLGGWPAVMLVAVAVVMVCVVAVVVGECGVEACPVASPLYRVYQQGGRADWPDTECIHAVWILSNRVVAREWCACKGQLLRGRSADVQLREVVTSWATNHGTAL